jgi:hypothetical protein
VTFRKKLILPDPPKKKGFSGQGMSSKITKIAPTNTFDTSTQRITGMQQMEVREEPGKAPQIESKEPGKMTKCFMNGKSCIYERIISERISAERERKPGAPKKAFIIMPFNKKLDAMYKWVVNPFLVNGGPEDRPDSDNRYKPERADDITHLGYIICEKICKKIQEADLVVVDVSFDNANVFYEFGLSVALRKTILPLCLEENWPHRRKLLERLGITKVLEYERFKEIDKNIKDYFLQKEQFKTYIKFDEVESDHIQILAYDMKDLSPNTPAMKTIDDFNYDFGSLCRQSVKQAFSEIFSPSTDDAEDPLRNYYKAEEIKKFNNIESTDLSHANCEHVLAKLKRSACVLVDVSENRNENYFWLGYIHGMGANAIPISVVRNRVSSSDIKEELPFDVRALWSIAFPEDNPEMLKSSLTDILESIYRERAKNRNRRRFWSQILTDGAVSVFLGSRYLRHLERNALGDWDYRTAAEITSFLSSQKETIKVTLESPIAWRPRLALNKKDEYARWLRSQLKDKNCIIVASADVNDLTEVALCDIFNHRKLFGHGDGTDREQKPFEPIPDDEYRFRGFIAYKKYEASIGRNKGDRRREEEIEEKENAFYKRESSDHNERGFMVRRGKMEKPVVQAHASLTQNDKGLKELLGQLIVARNPHGHKKWIIIISGISGPATLGIAQMLTGCVYKEFTTNGISPEKEVCSDTVLKECKKINTEETLTPPNSCPNRSKDHKDEKKDRDCRDCIYRAISIFTDKFSDQTVPFDKKELKIPYDALSEKLLEKLISSSRENECNAIITVGVYYPGTNSTQSTVYSNDERKIVAWAFTNLTPKLDSEWKNPTALDLAPSSEVGI